VSNELLVFRDFAIALFIGALVGIEREKRKEREAGGIGGLRTFMLVAVAGAAAAFVSQRLASGWIFVGALAAVGLLVAVSHHAEMSVDRTAGGATTEVAALVVFLLGGATIAGGAEIAVALAIATSAVLALKQTLHEAVGRIDADDFVSGLKLLFASFIVLPLLPNRALDPLGALNPYKLWLLVVLISGLSLAGYVAVRWLGSRKGTALTGLAGGLVSSTAVTLSFARRSREEQGTERALAVGVLLAWTVMFGRVLATVAIVNVSLAPSLAASMVVMGGVAAIASALALRHAAAVEAGHVPAVKVKNPFSLASAIKFGLFFACILLVVALARRYLPREALLVVAAVAGSTDVDAISLSMAKLAESEDMARLATRAIVLAAVSNTAAKAVMAAVLGSRPFARRILASTVAIAAAAGVAMAVGW